MAASGTGEPLKPARLALSWFVSWEIPRYPQEYYPYSGSCSFNGVTYSSVVCCYRYWLLIPLKCLLGKNIPCPHPGPGQDPRSPNFGPIFHPTIYMASYILSCHLHGLIVSHCEMWLPYVWYGWSTSWGGSVTGKIHAEPCTCVLRGQTRPLLLLLILNF